MMGHGSQFLRIKNWEPDVIKYYEQFQRDMEKISNSDCKIVDYYNDTSDAFLHLLSPFRQFQWFPFADGPFGRATPDNLNRLNKLRPDLNYQAKIDLGEGIVLFFSGDQDEFNERTRKSTRIPANYKIYSSYIIPKL
jgi:hypothetical protein